MKLPGKVAIVTGGAVRLGKAIALALADAGVNIGLHYGRSAQAAQETVEAIVSLGVGGCAIQADLGEPAHAARRIVERTIARFGHVDILVNSAAIFADGTLLTTTEDEWDRQFAVNLKAPFFLSQTFAFRRRHGERGHIINIADWRANRPGPDHLAYTLTKSGLVTLTKSLAQELAPDVQVNAIAPGAILPPPGKEQSDLDRLAQQIPLRRAGSPADVTEAVRFLLGSDFITGETLCVSGGEHL